jgi:hypothetical protein
MSRKYKFAERKGAYFVSFATVNWIDVFTPLPRESFCVVNVIKYERDACNNLGNGEKCATFTFFFRKNYYL